MQCQFSACGTAQQQQKNERLPVPNYVKLNRCKTSGEQNDLLDVCMSEAKDRVKHQDFITVVWQMLLSEDLFLSPSPLLFQHTQTVHLEADDRLL